MLGLLPLNPGVTGTMFRESYPQFDILKKVAKPVWDGIFLCVSVVGLLLDHSKPNASTPDDENPLVLRQWTKE